MILYDLEEKQSYMNQGLTEEMAEELIRERKETSLLKEDLGIE